MNTAASRSRRSAPQRRGLSAAARRTGLALALGACFLSTHPAYAASATWNAAPTDSNWVTSGSENNWSTGVATYPGSTTGTTNQDTATFNNASSQMAITINQVLNILSITFDTAAANYTIGSAGANAGNALELSSGGTTQIASTFSGTGKTETINAPLILEPASSTTAGTYTFANNSTTASNILNVAGNITLDATSATDTLNLAGTNTGTNTLAGTLTQSASTAAGGLIINKSGTGAWTFGASGGSGASTLAKGQLNVSAGTFNFATAATDTTSLALNGQTGAGGNVGVYVKGGTFNMNGGTLTTSGTTQGLIIQNNGTVYNQTAGLFNTNNDFIAISNGGTTTANISGGTLETSSSSRIEMAVHNGSTLNLSGTGIVSTGTLVMTTNQVNNAVTTVFNLGNGTVGGGTLVTGTIIQGIGSGSNTTFNFNGGTLRASASSTTFMQGLSNAFVKSGGAVIDTQANNDTIAQNLLTDTVSTGGGLTKSGTGTLVLSGTNTYTGATQISGGILGINSDASLGADPASATSNNIQFTGTNALPATLQDTTNNVTLNPNRGISIANGSTAILDASSNVFSVGGPVSLTSGSAATTLTLTGTNTTTPSILTGTVSDAGSSGGLILNKTGAGAWTFGGNGTSTLAKGEITENGGTLNFGDATDTPTLSINGTPPGDAGNVGVFVGQSTATGNFNMNAGTLNVTAGQGLVLNTTNTYTQTGGAFTTSGLVEFANGTSSAVSTVNISGGSLKTTNTTADGTDLAVRGTTTVNLSGTGTFTTPTLNMSTSQIGSGAATSTFNLNGGTLVTGTVIKGTGGSTGTQTFNFNGGTLQASAGSTTFMQGLTSAVVKGSGSAPTTGAAGSGANIDANGKAITIGQTLTGGGGTDGGLVVTSSVNGGALTLSGAAPNTYTGGTTVGNGTNTVTLNLSKAGADGSGTLTVNKNATVNVTVSGADTSTDPVINGGTYTVSANNALGSPTTIENGGKLVNAATGTYGTGGLNNGTYTGGNTQNGGVLTIGNGTNIIDFGAGNKGAVFQFADSSAVNWTGTLNIYDWMGNYPTGPFTPNGPGTTGGDGLDELFFGTTNTGLTSTQLSDIKFYSDQGSTLLGGGVNTILSDGEVSPAPEPSQYGMMGLMAFGLGGLILRAKKRQANRAETAA